LQLDSSRSLRLRYFSDRTARCPVTKPYGKELRHRRATVRETFTYHLFERFSRAPEDSNIVNWPSVLLNRLAAAVIPPQDPLCGCSQSELFLYLERSFIYARACVDPLVSCFLHFDCPIPRSNGLPVSDRFRISLQNSTLAVSLPRKGLDVT
jgi:hypothetical protein